MRVGVSDSVPEGAALQATRIVGASPIYGVHSGVTCERCNMGSISHFFSLTTAFCSKLSRRNMTDALTSAERSWTINFAILTMRELESQRSSDDRDVRNRHSGLNDKYGALCFSSRPTSGAAAGSSGSRRGVVNSLTAATTNRLLPRTRLSVSGSRRIAVADWYAAPVSSSATCACPNSPRR